MKESRNAIVLLFRLLNAETPVAKNDGHKKHEKSQKLSIPELFFWFISELCF